MKLGSDVKLPVWSAPDYVLISSARYDTGVGQKYTANEDLFGYPCLKCQRPVHNVDRISSI